MIGEFFGPARLVSGPGLAVVTATAPSKPRKVIPMNSPAKLTDTQLVILSAASQRKDRCLIAPKTLKAAAAQKVAAKLLKAGLVREIKAKTGMEIWRRDEETGQAYSLKLTVAGLKTIAVDERGSQSIPSRPVSQNTNEDSSKTKTAASMPAARSAMTAPTTTAPRQGTKIARVVELLQRDQGAKLDELIAATGSGKNGPFRRLSLYFSLLPGSAAIADRFRRTASATMQSRQTDAVSGWTETLAIPVG